MTEDGARSAPEMSQNPMEQHMSVTNKAWRAQDAKAQQLYDMTVPWGDPG